MWRRVPATSLMPIPTYHPEDGADSHAHSPRRRPKSMSANISTNMTSGPATQSADCHTALHANHSAIAFNQTVCQSQQGIPRIGQLTQNDPGSLFSEQDAYQEWLTNISANVNDICKTEFGSSFRLNRRFPSSDTSMPDYTSTHSSGKMSITMMDPLATGIIGACEERQPSHLNATINAPMGTIKNHRIEGIRGENNIL